jgi:sugar lactone lactonase YvrE
MTERAAPLPITATRDKVGECPVWSVAEQALYWVDIEGRRIHRFDAETKIQKTWHTVERVGCIALTQNRVPDSAYPQVLAAMESGIFELTLLDAPAARERQVAAVLHPRTNMRFNDGRCDAQGRFWVGTMCMDMSLAAEVGGLFCLDERGLTGPYLDGFITPNGMGFSPDGRTMYVSDSHPSIQKIWALDFDANSGTPSNRRLFVDMTDLPGRPDGAAVDALGNYWICGNDAGQVHCFSPQGQLLASHAVPVSKPSMCAFGGPLLDTLFVASIQPANPTGNDVALAGGVFALRPGVCGVPEPVFTRLPI